MMSSAASAADQSIPVQIDIENAATTLELIENLQINTTSVLLNDPETFWAAMKDVN